MEERKKKPFLSIENYDQSIRLTVINAKKNALHFPFIHSVVCQKIEYQIELKIQVKIVQLGLEVSFIACLVCCKKKTTNRVNKDGNNQKIAFR